MFDLLTTSYFGACFMRDGELWVVVAAHGRPDVKSMDELKNMAVYGAFVTACKSDCTFPAPIFLMPSPTKEEAEAGIAEARALGILKDERTEEPSKP